MYNGYMSKCIVKDCNRESRARGYCDKHIAMFYRCGYIKERNNRMRNEIIIKGNISEIILYTGDSIPTTKTIIDTEDVDKIKDIKWALAHGYAKSYTLKIGLHNYITGFKPTDHINGDPLDNRKSNLRKATLAENNRNTSYQKNSKCPFKGVSPDPMLKSRPYMASICSKKIGRFETMEEAAWMYDQYAVQIYGDFARLNFEYI